MELVFILLIILVVAFFSIVGPGGSIIYVPLFYWLGIDLDIMCSILEELGMPEMRCSAKSGAARFRLDDWQVMIYRNGHIDIRRVKDIDDAAKAIEMVGIMLKDGFTG